MTKLGKKGIPDNVMQMLAAADKQNGLPPGTMASVMQQEVGGQSDKYLTDPTAYHYGLNADGKRIAGHTGKVSTAFGPFGILESTGRDPGYGVKPLQSKDLGEQIRFASEYMGAQIKRKGGVKEGMAAYGEGPKYAEQVASRLPGGWGRESRGNAVGSPASGADAVAPEAMVAGSPVEALASVAPSAVAAVTPLPTPLPAVNGPDAWQQFLAANRAPAPAVKPEQLSYGPGMGMPSMSVQRPDFLSTVSQGSRQVDFSAFGSWGRRA